MGDVEDFCGFEDEEEGEGKDSKNS